MMDMRSAWIPVTEESLADMEGMRCAMWVGIVRPMELMASGAPTPVLTEEEERTGWQTVTHEDHTHEIAVGWRLEQNIREAKEREEAERAACPYVACECGWHEG